MKLLTVSLLALMTTLVFANITDKQSCEDGNADRRMCVNLISNLHRKGSKPNFQRKEHNLKLTCYKNFSGFIYGNGTADWNPDVYESTLRVRNYQVTAGNTALSKTIAYVDSGNDFWGESSDSGIKYSQDDTNISIHSTLREVGLEEIKMNDVMVSVYKEQLFVVFHHQESVNDGYVKFQHLRKDFCIQKI